LAGATTIRIRDNTISKRTNEEAEDEESIADYCVKNITEVFECIERLIHE